MYLSHKAFLKKQHGGLRAQQGAHAGPAAAPGLVRPVRVAGAVPDGDGGGGAGGGGALLHGRGQGVRIKQIFEGDGEFDVDWLQS